MAGDEVVFELNVSKDFEGGSVPLADDKVLDLKKESKVEKGKVMLKTSDSQAIAQLQSMPWLATLVSAPEPESAPSAESGGES